MTPEEQINLNLETANRFRSDALVMSEANVKGVVGRLYTKEQAEFVARRLFEIGDDPNNECSRINFRGAPDSNGKESDLGGLCEKALVSCLVDIFEAWNKTV